jgi:hypothetical protein
MWNDKEKGFTLVEIAGAVLIFLTGIVGVISLFAAATMFHKGASDKTNTVLAIQQVVSKLELRLAAGDLRLGSGELSPQAEGVIYGQDRYRYRAELEELGVPGQSMVQATIHVTWKDRGKERSESFHYIFRPGLDAYGSVEAFLGEAPDNEPPPGR